MGLGDLVVRIITFPIKGTVEREVRKASRTDITKMVADYLGSEKFRTDLTGSLSDRLDETVEKLLTNRTLGMEAQQAIIAAIQARHPTYEPVLILENAWNYELGTPIATVNGYGRGRDGWEAYHLAMVGLKSEARAMGGKLVVLTLNRLDGNLFSSMCKLTGELYVTIPERKTSVKLSSS